MAPEKIEIIYARSPMVAQVFVHGESLKSVVVAIVVPDEAQIRKWAKGIADADESAPMVDLVRNPALKKAILDEMIALGKAASLASFEQVKDIYLEGEMWTAENELLTPTFKTKRPALIKKYRGVIDEMYEELW